MTDLFHTERKKDARAHYDFSLMALREKFTLPDGWEIYAWELKNMDTDAEYILHSGAVVTATYSRGPRKGEKNWAKSNRQSEMDLPLTCEEIAAFLAKWTAETGLCHHCHGNGTAWHGWSAARGNDYRICRHCAGTGRAVMPGVAE